MTLSFEGYIISTTLRAVLFHGHYWCEPQWFPFSQVTIRTPDDGVQERVLEASPWICQQKDLDEFADINCATEEDYE